MGLSCEVLFLNSCCAGVGTVEPIANLPADGGDSASSWDYTLENVRPTAGANGAALPSVPARGADGPGRGDFPQTRPAKPRPPQASTSQSGFSRVTNASTAATAVIRTAIQERSDATARTSPLALISPIDR